MRRRRFEASEDGRGGRSTRYFRTEPATPSREQLNGSIFRSDVAIGVQI